MDWINICKGVGIYLVVLGHCNVNPSLHRFIYLFHMPLFFCLSGYLHQGNADFRSFFKTKAARLLLPYLSFLVMLYPLRLASIVQHHGWDHSLLVNAFTDAVWGGNRLQVNYGVFWFLPCLFFTQQLMNFLLVRFGLLTAGLLTGAGCLLGYANALYAPRFFLPLDMNVVLGAMPFFYLGFVARRSKWGSPFYAVCGVAGTVCAGCLAYSNHPTIVYNMRDAVYGVPGLSFVLACCCVIFLAGVSRFIVRLEPLRSVLGHLGGASMGVMFLHKALLGAPGIAGWSWRHGYSISVLVTAVSYAVTWLLRRSVLSRALLLGSENDLRKLLGRTRAKTPLPDNAHGARSDAQVSRGSVA